MAENIPRFRTRADFIPQSGWLGRKRTPPHFGLALILLVSLASTKLATAQLRPLIIKDASVMLDSGVLSDATTIKVSGGKIEAVSPGIKPGFFAKTICAEGKTVAPGFIDCWSGLGLDEGGPATPDATARAIDAFDRYATTAMRDALAQGVTTVFLSPAPSAGVSGLGTVLRITTRGDVGDRILLKEAALCGSVGVAGPANPIARVQAAAEVRENLRAALDYRESLDDYEEDLEEYEEKLKELAENKTNEGSDDEAKDATSSTGKGSEDKKEKPKADSEDTDEKKNELKKPAQPSRNPQAEMWLRVLDGELPLRIEAHRPEDILNVLRLADEFTIKLILVGASGGHLVADQIAAADIPVILGVSVTTARFQHNAYRYHAPDNAAKLARAGVPVYVAGGPPIGLPGPDGMGHPGKFTGLNAALAVGHGLDAATAMRNLTSGAAELLGVGDRVGRVAPGMDADLVIWTGHPLAPDAKVDMVLIGGVIVYDASRDWPFGEDK